MDGSRQTSEEAARKIIELCEGIERDLRNRRLRPLPALSRVRAMAERELSPDTAECALNRNVTRKSTARELD